MTQLAVVGDDSRPLAPARPPTRGLQLTTLDEMYNFAEIVCGSGFAPKDMNTVEKVFVALSMGLELGFSPMQAIQNMAVVNGRPGPFGDASIAVIRQSGLLEQFEEHFEDAEGTIYDDVPPGHKNTWPTDIRAVCTVKRRGHAPRTETFSIAAAKQANLWDKSGPWQQYPLRMLRFRARGFALRDEFADVLKGFISAEELADYPAEEPAPVVVRSARSEAVPQVAPQAALMPSEPPPIREMREGFWWLNDLENRTDDELKRHLSYIKKDVPDHPQRAALGVEWKRRYPPVAPAEAAASAPAAPVEVAPAPAAPPHGKPRKMKAGEVSTNTSGDIRANGDAAPPISLTGAPPKTLKEKMAEQTAASQAAFDADTNNPFNGETGPASDDEMTLEGEIVENADHPRGADRETISDAFLVMLEANGVNIQSEESTMQVVSPMLTKSGFADVRAYGDLSATQMNYLLQRVREGKLNPGEYV